MRKGVKPFWVRNPFVTFGVSEGTSKHDELVKKLNRIRNKMARKSRRVNRERAA